jgi:hypothetical protein
MAISFSKGIASAFGKAVFHGFFLSLDNIFPPIYLKFMANPNMYIDDWNVDFHESRTPFTRAPRIEWVGNSSRKITFSIWYDDGIAGINCGDKPAGDDPSIFSHAGGISTEVFMSLIDQLRLPKNPLIRAAMSILNIVPESRYLAEASPPKTIMMLGYNKFVQGYLVKATTKDMKFNAQMIPIRVHYDMEFLVEPGTWIEKIEDVFRIINTVIGAKTFIYGDLKRMFSA